VLRPVVVYGAGALGSLLGALLSRRTTVQLVARGAHAEAVRAQGGVRLTVLEPGLYPLRIGDGEEIPETALVLVTVKAYDLEAALTRLAPRLGARHLVVVLQNGLGIQSLAQRLLGPDVLRAVTFMAASLVEPGVVAYNAAGKTYLPAHGEEVLGAWRDADMPAVQVPDIRTYVWRKLAINAVINPLSALLGVPNGELLALRETGRGLVEELVPVARREGQPIEVEETWAKVRASMRQTARNTSSMLQDVRAGRRTEIDWINGAVVRRAERHGLAVPRHRQLAEMVRFLERRAAPTPQTVRLA
jgi:2-dehydropantoate 2-reductase